MSGPKAAGAPKRPVLFVNPRSGGGKAARAGLAERARERSIDTHGREDVRRLNFA